MKRSHIHALTCALHGRTHLVASLHVLSQPTLDDDDHAFLAEVAPRLASVDLLRWLARCAADGPRARIIAALAGFAARDPRRFEAEILGANLSFLQDEDWAELHERLRAVAAPRLADLALARTSGASVYRALARPTAPLLAPDRGFFPDHYDLDAGELAARVARAFEAASARQHLLRVLFPVRHDERACLAALRDAVTSAHDREPLLWAIASAGLLDQAETAAATWPAQTRFGGAGDEDATLRAAAVRWLAARSPGGLDWLAIQVDEALGRGSSVEDVLGDLGEPARREVWDRSPALRAQVTRHMIGATARRLEELQRTLPWAISDELILTRQLLPGAGLEAAPAAQLATAACERARTTLDGRECASLLAWLEQRGVSRRVLLEIATETIGRGVLGLDLLTWLSRRLVTRSAWEQHGRGLLAALLARGAFSELAELFALAWSEAGGVVAPRPVGETIGAPDAASPAGFREAAHAAFSLALVDHTRAAIAAGDEAAALRALSALACLDPPSRLNSVLHELGRDPRASEATRELIEVNASLCRRGSGREATLHGLVSAIHVLSQS
jgi:hypothetical protein